MANLGLAAVCLGLAALAAATFVLSYSGIRAVALQAGITAAAGQGLSAASRCDAGDRARGGARAARRWPAEQGCWPGLTLLACWPPPPAPTRCMPLAGPAAPVGRDYRGRTALGAGIPRVRAAARHAPACQAPAGGWSTGERRTARSGESALAARASTATRSFG